MMNFWHLLPDLNFQLCRQSVHTGEKVELDTFDFVTKVENVTRLTLSKSGGRRSTFCREYVQQSRTSAHTSDEVEFDTFDFVDGRHLLCQ